MIAIVPIGYAACNASGKITDGGGYDASPPDVARDHFYNTVGAGGQPAIPPPTPNPLCGVVKCNPDQVSACIATGGAGGHDGGGASAGAAGAAPSNPGTAGAAGGGFKLPELDGGEPLPGVACQVTREGGKPSAQCETAGSAGNGDPCVGPADCQPGLACVSDDKVGRCLPYCCGGNDSCTAAGTYCSTRPLRDPTAGDADPLIVPVCVPADNCNLAEPYPCTGNMSCTCPQGTACTVVRSDGTRACVVPGSGVEGDDCTKAACAWGFICSKATNTCLKLCTVNANSSDCGTRRCQSAADLPSNWGVCVGDATDGG